MQMLALVLHLLAATNATRRTKLGLFCRTGGSEYNRLRVNDSPEMGGVLRSYRPDGGSSRMWGI